MSRLIESGTTDGVGFASADETDAPLNVAGEFNVAGTLNLEQALNVSGTVFDESQTPVENATVALTLQSGGTSVEYTTTDVNGDYNFFAHRDADGTGQLFHVAAYDDEAPIFNAFSKPFVSTSLNLATPGSVSAAATLSGIGGPSTGVNSATGGTTVTTFTDSSGQEYQIHAFENVGTDTFEVTDAAVDAAVDVLIIGGGGGGGASNSTTAGGGGGGAGGLIFTSVSAPVGTQTINVGGGGAAGTSNQDVDGQNGDDTTAFGLTALGGGGGGARGRPGLDGGSGGGGGSGSEQPGGVGLQPSGFEVFGADLDGGDGGTNALSSAVNNAAGGGGGSSFAGMDGNDNSAGGGGGDGIDFSDEWGTAFGEGAFGGSYFAAGGGGGDGDGPDFGVFVSGGVGGGGDAGEDAVPSTGSGGGGQRFDGGPAAGDGGSGIVLIRYEI